MIINNISEFEVMSKQEKASILKEGGHTPEMYAALNPSQKEMLLRTIDLVMKKRRPKIFRC